MRCPFTSVPRWCAETLLTINTNTTRLVREFVCHQRDRFSSRFGEGENLSWSHRSTVGLLLYRIPSPEKLRRRKGASAAGANSFEYSRWRLCSIAIGVSTSRTSRVAHLKAPSPTPISSFLLCCPLYDSGPATRVRSTRRFGRGPGEPGQDAQGYRVGFAERQRRASAAASQGVHCSG